MTPSVKSILPDEIDVSAVLMSFLREHSLGRTPEDGSDFSRAFLTIYFPDLPGKLLAIGITGSTEAQLIVD